MKVLITQYFQTFCDFFLLRPNILLSTLYSNSLSQYSLNVRDQFVPPCETTGKIIVLYSLISKFLEEKQEDKRL
jgi:hypothetical protein